MNLKQRNYLCYLLLVLGYVSALNANANPFPLLDARSAAMGESNIAQSIRNAAFYNPALAALETDEYDWYAMVPSYGEVTTDPDKVKDAVKDIINGTGDTAKIISDINNSKYQKYTYNSFQLAVPSPILGGAAYISKYSFQTEKVKTELGSTYLEHRALDVFETGVSVAQLQNIMWFQNVLVGLTAKLLLIESYGYQEAIANADFSLDSNQVKRNSMLNLDLGFAKEYGVWKTALVIKNLIAQKEDFGNSNYSFSIFPQVKAAVAYKSRRNVIEADVDVTKNRGVGFGSDTRYASLGWEWKMFQSFNLRLGYQQNLVGTKKPRFSGGVGFNFWGFLVDVSTSVDADSRGTYLQAGWKF